MWVRVPYMLAWKRGGAYVFVVHMYLTSTTAGIFLCCVAESLCFAEHRYTCNCLVLFVPVINFSVMSGHFSMFLGWTSTKQR